MLRKGLAVTVILLFVGICVVPSTAVQELREVSSVSFDGNTLYVGGSGQNNYTKIQDAIDNSSYGDTVFVYSGTYVENIDIPLHKDGINIIGEDKNNTIIDGEDNGYVITMSSDFVNITNFYLRGNYGIHLWGLYNNISNNNILSRYLENEESYIGIEMVLSNRFNTISGNYINGFSEYGIYAHESWGNIFINNTITDCSIGIRMYDSGENFIFKNKIIDCSYGIMLSEVTRNDISYNLIQNANIGIQIVFISTQNYIDHNNFLDNEIHAWFSGLSLSNRWIYNYWNEIRFTPYPIFGNYRYSILWFLFLAKFFGIYPPIPTFVVFDWYPALKPYDIGV